MGEIMIECILCGVSFGSEKLYDAHLCMEDDVKVPFKTKMEPDDKEAELEEEVQKVLDQAANSCKEPLLSNVKEDPLEVDFEEVDPLEMTEEEVEQLLSKGGISVSSSDTTAEVNDEAENDTKGTTWNECLICGERFFRRKHFLNHKINAHKVPRPYECKVCGERFTQRHRIFLPVRVRTGERPYKCTMCSISYKYKISFIIHMKTHNVDLDICSKRCFKSSLTSHSTSHTKETRFQCEICGRHFPHLKNLLLHCGIHTEKPYVCKYCGKCFRILHSHKIHVRLHTGERPYKCNVCGKSFRRGNSMRLHMHSHRGIKPFKCSICSVYCATQASITDHIDLHHPDLMSDNPIAPEKTVVRNSICGVLGIEAPQPRTVFKPIATPLQEAEETASDVQEQKQAIVADKKGSDGKAKVLFYKDYLDSLEKKLTDRGHVIKDSKTSKAGAKAGDGSKKINCASQSKGTQSAVMNKGNGKQIMILAPQNVQSGENNVLILSNQNMASPAAQMVQSVAPTVPATGPQLILGSPSVSLPQPQAQQLILLSPAGLQQNSMSSSSLLLLATPGSNGQRLLLLPKQATTQSSQGNQVMSLPSELWGE